jgi:hypothetical protein
MRARQAPVLLVEPLGELAVQLVAVRKDHATVGHPGTSPWLLPGAGRATRRAPSTGRSAATAWASPPPEPIRRLPQLAVELPAAVLARPLGVSTYGAAAWQRIAGGACATRAAQHSRRAHQQAAGRPDAG